VVVLEDILIIKTLKNNIINKKLEEKNIFKKYYNRWGSR
jgi:hypothetical protein